MITLHRAPWVLPISAPALADGAVLVDGTEIRAVGRYADLRTERFDREVDHDGHLLMPALINCHCHLELAGCAEMTDMAVQPGNMPAWISELLALRASKADGGVDRQASTQALDNMHNQGIGAVVDIGNGLNSPVGEGHAVEVHYFSELLGLSEKGMELAWQVVMQESSSHPFTCHAPYSTHPDLLVRVKERARKLAQLYSIHVAESLDELEFLASGEGRFRTFLEERGVWDGSFVAPGKGAVSYLAELGVLDEKSLCVHCVHVGEAEIELLVQTAAKVCLCPGSNRFLAVGKAPVPQMLAAGLRPCLGTDSLASNPELSLWREMNILAQDHPELEPQAIVAMATLHGGEAVGEKRLGHLAPGSSARMIAVRFTGDDPFAFLACATEAKDVVWL